MPGAAAELRIRPERSGDEAGVRAVQLAAFAPSTGEARLVELLRSSEAHVPQLCLVALEADTIIGHVAFSLATLGGEQPVLALAPLAVAPGRQGRGVGTALTQAAIERARGLAYPLIIVLGHAAYYPRFGFEPAAALGITAPFEVPSDAWMACRLPAYTPEARGKVRYADAFAAVG